MWFIRKQTHMYKCMHISKGKEEIYGVSGEVRWGEMKWTKRSWRHKEGKTYPYQEFTTKNLCWRHKYNLHETSKATYTIHACTLHVLSPSPSPLSFSCFALCTVHVSHMHVLFFIVYIDIRTGKNLNWIEKCFGVQRESFIQLWKQFWWAC